LKILGTSILTAMVVLLSGIISGQPISAIIYLSVLILLRKNVGGYHSSTYLGCLSLTILNFMLIILLQINLKQNYKEVIGIIFIIYSTIKIYMIKPQVNQNRIINDEVINICNFKKI
ncbi:MAG: accessory gene regulator B family protein, partial [Tissierella sp.]|uniref:accessory gene regulator B family protein n=1 Tax=Tissierella sp. TaxID=41274 RepID=UPI003F9754DB